MLLLVPINLVKVYGGIIAGTPGTPEFGGPLSIGLALATVGFTVLFAQLFKGMLGQLAVLLGLLAGAALAWALGVMSFADVWTRRARQRAHAVSVRHAALRPDRRDAAA